MVEVEHYELGWYRIGVDDAKNLRVLIDYQDGYGDITIQSESLSNIGMCHIPLPDGYRFARFDFPFHDEIVLIEGQAVVYCESHANHEYVILERKINIDVRQYATKQPKTTPIIRK